jgi:hypothetical protein
MGKMPQRGRRCFLTRRLRMQVQGAALLHRSDCARIEYARSPTSSDADGLRASELEHAVQGTDSDRSLSRTTPVSPRAQRVTDHSFEAADS